jgi:YVTN family beta-propeller protein
MRLARFVICATVMSVTMALSALAAPFAYVSNEGSASVSVIDTATDKVTATFDVGGKPRGIALSPDRKRLYVSDQTGNAALTVDTSNGCCPPRSRRTIRSC